MPIQKKEQTAISMFRQALDEQLGEAIHKVVLFGSKARGDDRAESDIDLLILCNTDDWHIANTVYAIATDVLLATGVALSPKVLAREEYRRMERNSMPFVSNVVREGVAV